MSYAHGDIKQFSAAFDQSARMREALEKARAYIETQVEEQGYGFFPGGDPIRFSPDEESNTPEEIENWKAACERWNCGDKTGEEGSHRWLTDTKGNVIGTATVSNLGFGSYTFINDEAKAIKDEIDQALSSHREDTSIGWIDASLKLPESKQSVLAVFNTGYKDTKRISRVVYIAAMTTKVEDFWDGDDGNCTEYNEEEDCYYVDAGWYEDSYESETQWKLSNEVTHWMPLPNLPGINDGGDKE